MAPAPEKLGCVRNYKTVVLNRLGSLLVTVIINWPCYTPLLFFSHSGPQARSLTLDTSCTLRGWPGRIKPGLTLDIPPLPSALISYSPHIPQPTAR